MKKLLVESFQKLDFIIWGITLLFFIGSALLLWWNVNESFMWASWIIVLMFLVWFSIELILASLKNVKWVWKITWFITNWPEALVMIVWLIWGNILFAASTPLWSNFVNPILLFLAILITWYFVKIKKFNHKLFFLFWFFLTAFFALLFMNISEEYYVYWLIFAFIAWVALFLKKHKELEAEIETEDEEPVSKLYLPLWIVILLISWYFLDPVVNFTADASLAPKWIIWFLVLATLTSWPEFKSVIALLKRNKTLDAFENILISNITNLWLAVFWILVRLYMK